MKAKNEYSSRLKTGSKDSNTSTTMLKKALEVLRESEEKYRFLFDAAPVGIGIADLEGNVLDANLCMQRMSGFTLEELRQAGVRATYVNPDERRLLIETLQETGRVRDMEVRLRRKGGKEYSALLNVDLVELGRQRVLLTTARDVTEHNKIKEALQQSEKKYSTLVEKGNDGIVILQDGILKFGNSMITEITGFTKEEVIEKPFTEFVSPAFKEIVIDRYNKRIAGEKVPDKYEIEIISKDDKNIPVEINASLIEYEGRPADMGIIRDISERKRVEKELDEAILKAEDEKSKSEAILAAIGDGIIIQDTDYRILYQNQIQNELYGNRVGEYCYKAYEGRDNICEDCPVESSFRDGKIHRRERTVPTDRGILHVELTSSPLRDSTGKIISGIKVVRNITERKLAEEKLREGERFLVSIFESIKEGIGIIDKDMNIIRINSTAENWYPHAMPLVGKKCYEAFHGRNEPCEICPARRTLNTGESAYDIIPKSGPDGEDVGWLEIHSYPMIDTATGQMRGVIEYVREITERRRAEEALRESEEKFRNIVEQSGDGIVLTDEQGIIIEWNRSEEQIIGMKRAEVIGRPIWDVQFEIVPEERKTQAVYKKLKADLLELIRSGQSHFSDRLWEMDIQRPDGTRLSVQIQVFLIRTNKGFKAGSITRDITERKLTEEKIKNYALKLEESNRLKELFIDIMHHDLLNPMTTVNGFVELLKENEIDLQKRAYLETIERNLLKGMELIENATRYSKLESLESIELECLDMKEVIEEVIENLAPLATKFGMKVENNIIQKTPARANKIIREVFDNFISNAMKYASTGKKIRVDRDDGGEFWKIRVMDFGEGINDNDKAGIFKRFQRADKKGVKGSGLGLAIASKIMELHSGRIWVEDNPEGGAVFILEIPKYLN